MIVDSHAPGEFCWVELSTSNQNAAKSFYGELFGWQAEDMPMGPDSVYTMFHIDGKYVAAGFQEGNAQKPSYWGTYIAVASADDAAAKAKELGGTVVADAFDVFDAGRMAVIQDPTGATFCVWQAKGHIGIQRQGEDNTFCWDELSTRNVAAAKTFYTSLFGWGAKDGDYVEFMLGDRPIGGMMAMPSQVPDFVPAHWLPYFQVSSCNSTFDKAKGLGAEELVAPMDIPGVGRFAVVKDPQGAAFAFVTLS